MAAEKSLQELGAELALTTTRLDQIAAKLGNARVHILPAMGRTDDAALIVAGYIETYYTALETFFMRVSQHFENNLPADRWHSALLEKMRLSIHGEREAVLQERTLSGLRELLRFRHFRRYYVEMEYDWTRIDFLLAILDDLHPRVLADLSRFGAFLVRLADAEEG